MSTMSETTPVGYLNARDKNLVGQLIMHSVKAVSVKIHDSPQDRGEAVYLDDTVAEMAEKIERLELRTTTLERDLFAVLKAEEREVAERDRWQSERDAVVVQRDELKAAAQDVRADHLERLSCEWIKENQPHRVVVMAALRAAIEKATP